MITVPDSFATDTIAREGDTARDWLANLPGLVETLCMEWNLLLDGPPIPGYLALVIPTRRGDERLTLKVSWMDDSTARETMALATWAGRGAVQLLAAAPDRGAMLLERLNSRRSLADLPIHEARHIAGQLLRRLAVPSPVGPPRLTMVAHHLHETLPARWEQAGRPMPRQLLDLARDLAVQLGPTAGNLLVNYDLHYGNVLAGVREPWLAIDPKVVAGDPEYGLAQLLWTRLDDLPGAAGLEQHVQALVEAAALDPPRAYAWSLLRTVDYWLWAVSVGLTIDPVRCEVVATWLAGKHNA